MSEKPTVVHLMDEAEVYLEERDEERGFLAALFTNPGLVSTLTLEEVPITLLQIRTLYQGLELALTNRLLTRVNHHPPSATGASTEDRLLGPGETAVRLGVTEKWLYRNVKQLPFARRLGRRSLRFSEAGLRRWVEKRRT